jgi:hypothetical protein
LGIEAFERGDGSWTDMAKTGNNGLIRTLLGQIRSLIA